MQPCIHFMTIAFATKEDSSRAERLFRPGPDPLRGRSHHGKKRETRHPPLPALLARDAFWGSLSLKSFPGW